MKVIVNQKIEVRGDVKTMAYQIALGDSMNTPILFTKGTTENLERILEDAGLLESVRFDENDVAMNVKLIHVGFGRHSLSANGTLHLLNERTEEPVYRNYMLPDKITFSDEFTLYDGSIRLAWVDVAQNII